MEMGILAGLGALLASAAYMLGLWRWIYHGRLGSGMLSVLALFPVVIWLAEDGPLVYLRALPLFGVGMFIHRYGSRILMQIKLLWFTTLSVLVVQGYYLLVAFRLTH